MLFVVFGSIGFVWAFAWYRWFRDSPAEHPDVERGRAHVHRRRTRRRRPVTLEKTQWKRLLANSTVVCLCLMYFTQTFGNAFYVTWLPTYLASRGLTGMTAGILAGLPLTLSVAADLTGGITTDRAARRLGLRLGRIIVGGGALAAAGLFTIAAAFTASPIAAAVLIALGGASSNFLLGVGVGNVHRHRRPPRGRGERGDEHVGPGRRDPQPDSRRVRRAAIFDLERAAVSDGRAVSAGCGVLAVGRSDETGFRLSA